MAPFETNSKDKALNDGEGGGGSLLMRSPWFTAVHLLAVILVCLILLEMGMRFLLPTLDGREMVAFDPELGSVLRPGFEGVAQGVHVSINSHGLRSSEIPLEKPEGVYRILVLGDSWTFGVCVPQDKTYPAQLEHLLQSRHPHRRIEVINSGVSGYETYNESVYFRRSGWLFEPDLVLIGYYPVNDIHDKREKFKERARLQEENPLLFAIRRYPKENLQSYHYFQYGRSWMKDRILDWWRGTPSFDAGPEELDQHYKGEWTSLYSGDYSGWGLVQESLMDIGNLSREIGAKPVLAVFPDMRSLKHYRLSLRDRFFPQLESAANEAGLSVIDVFPAFAPYEDREEEIALWERKGSTHPNAKGYRIIAEFLLDRIMAGEAVSSVLIDSATATHSDEG